MPRLGSPNRQGTQRRRRNTNPPADREAVVDVIRNLAQIAMDWPEISEIEVNPLIVLGGEQGVYAVDARVRMVVD